MRRFSINPNYNAFFVNKQLTRLFINAVKGELNRLTNVPILRYIEKNYKISKERFIQLLEDNLVVSNYGNNLLVIDFNNLPIVIKSDNIDENNQNLEIPSVKYINLYTLIDLVNNGNLQVRGSNMFNDIIKYLQNNVGALYKISWMRKGSKLWQ